MANDETVRMCDLCPEQPAVAMYRWDWGEEGCCSQEGQMLLQQKAGQLNRHVSFMPLPNLAPPPMARDERTKLIAEKLAAESEAAEVAERSTRLYTQNQELQQTVRHLRTQLEHANASDGDLRTEIESLQEANASKDARLVKLEKSLAAAEAIVTEGPDAAQEEISSLRKQLETLRQELAEARSIG